MFFLVAYDISDPRRLRRVAKLMEEYGARVQRSVFECRLSDDMFLALVAELMLLIKPRYDRVNIYRSCASCPKFGGTGSEADSTDLDPIANRRSDPGVFIY